MGLTGGHSGAATEAAGAAAVVEGLARFAGSIVELPAVQARCLPEDERGRLADCLSDAWNLVAITEAGSVLLGVLDAGGATIELVEGAGESRRGVEGRGDEGRGDEGERDGTRIARTTSHSHGVARAAWGMPPGRRVAAMGLVPGPDGALLRMSVGLILRLPARSITDPVTVAYALAWHAAMHAAERRAMPAGHELAAALEVADRELSIPRGPRGRVAWARACAEQVVGCIGVGVPLA